jgi:hypothetical protein
MLDGSRVGANPCLSVGRSRFAVSGCEIVHTPQDFDRALAWAVERRKPFKENGAGAPDAAIWLTALQEAANADRVLLVTANSSDFAAKDNPARLDASLLSDITERGYPPERIEIVRSLAGAVKQVRDSLPLDELVSMSLLEGANGSEFLASVSESLARKPLPDFQLPFGVDLDEDAEIQSVDLTEAEVLSARDVGEDLLLVALSLRGVLTVEMFVYLPDWYGIEFDPRVRVIDPRWSDRYVLAEGEFDAYLAVEVTTSSDGRIHSVELVEVEPVTDEELLYERLDGEGISDVAQEAAMAAEGVALGEFSLSPRLEAPLESARITAVDAGTVALLDVLELDGTQGAVVELTARADVQWTCAAPTGVDLQRFGDALVGELDSGAWLQGRADGQAVMLVARLEKNHVDEWRLDTITRTEWSGVWEPSDGVVREPADGRGD